VRKPLLILLGLAALIAAAQRRTLSRRTKPPRDTNTCAPPPSTSIRFGKRHAVYLGLLLALVIASIGAATLVLMVRSPPEGEDQHVSIAFAVAGLSTFNQYGIYVVGEALAHVPDREPELRSSNSTEVQVEAAGCSNPVAVHMILHLDPRWLRAVRATRLHETLFLHTIYESGRATFAVRHPDVPGVFGLEVSEHITHVSAELIGPELHIPTSLEYQTGVRGNDTILTGDIPGAELRHISPSSDFQDGLLGISFLAPWVSPRGYQSCFVRLPALLNNSVFKPPLLRQNLDNLSDRSVGPNEGQTELTADGAEVDLSATNPAPNSSGRDRLWTCGSNSSQRPAQDLPDCHATVVLTEPNESAHLQLLTILLAAILSGALIAIGASIRRYLLGL
jgi:hypothetical protein